MSHQLQMDLDNSLAMVQQAELKRRMAEARASEADQDAQEVRQAMSRLKVKLSSAQEESSGLEEALQRERMVSVRLRQMVAQLGGGGGSIGQVMGGSSPWVHHQAAFNSVGGGYGLMGGMDVEMELLQQRRAQQQQASRHSALIVELEEEQRRLRQRCQDTRQELEALVQQQQDARLQVDQGEGYVSICRKHRV